MDRTRQVVVAAVIAGVLIAATYAAWPRTQRGETIILPPVGSQKS